VGCDQKASCPISQRLDPYQKLALAQLLRKRPGGEMRTAAQGGRLLPESRKRGAGPRQDRVSSIPLGIAEEDGPDRTSHAAIGGRSHFQVCALLWSPKQKRAGGKEPLERHSVPPRLGSVAS
jgi:hypothetical protein